jgi:translocation and assembly module TamB
VIRVIAWLIAALSGTVIAVLLAAFLAVGNPAASAWIVRQATALAPGSLVLQDISGNLVSGITLGSAHYELPAVRVTARNMVIRIRWLELIDGRLVFRRLLADALQIELIDDESSSSESGLPMIRTPLEIRIDRLEIGSLQLTGEGFEESLTNLAGRAQLADTQLAIDALTAMRQNLRLNLNGHLDFVDEYPLTAVIQWDIADDQLSGSGRFAGDLQALVFEHKLKIPDAVSISGRLADLTRRPSIDATASWATLAWSTEPGTVITSSGGRLRLTGTAERLTAQLQGRLSLPALPELSAEIGASGNADAIEITRLAVDGFGGSLTGSGRVLVGEQRITLELLATNLDPATIRPDLPGRLNATAAVDLHLPDRFDIDIKSLSGELLGQALRGKALISSTEQRWSVAGLKVNVANNELRFDGALVPELKGRFRVDADDLAAIWPELRGAIEGSGAVEGTLTTPVGRIALQATDLFYREQGAERLKIKGEIDSLQRVELLVSAYGLSMGDTQLGNLDTRVTGTVAAHEVQVELDGGVVGISLDAAGGWDGQQARYRPSSGQLDLGPGGQWQLAAPFDVQADASIQRIGAHCWTQNTAQLCLQDSQVSDATVQVAGSLDRIPMAAIEPWLGEDFSVDGTADATFILRRANSSLFGELTWRQRATRIDYRDSAGSVISTTIDDVRLDVRADRERTIATGKLRTNFGISVDLDAELAPSAAPDAAIDGRLKITAPEIGESMPLINRFVEVNKAKGRLDADLNISGTLGAPRIEGNANLTDGSVYIPQTGIEVEDIQFSLSGQNGTPIKVKGGARSGGGELTVDGVLDYTEELGAFADLTINGEKFQVIRLPDQSLYVSPDLIARIDDRQIRARGTVLIPTAEILIESLPESAAAPSADVIIEAATVERRPRRRAPVELVGELDLQLGDDVRFAGFGIDTRLTGALKLSRSAGAVNAVTEGNLRTVDGQFTAYRKQLTIDRGALIFVGSLADPNLDVRASRNMTYEGQPITVGVLLTGRLSAIQSRIFSEPAMSEADALSYLVLNRPLRQAEDSDSAELSSAALALGISQAMPITQELGENLGLDEIAIEGMSEDTTVLVAGRRLGEDLYLRYSYGLFNRIGTFIVRYDLRGGISVEAGSGEEQTLDLVFTIRR